VEECTKLLPDQAFRQRPPFPHDARTCHLPNSTSTTSLGSLIRRSSLVLRRPPRASHVCVHGNTCGHFEPEPRRRDDVMQHFQENTLVPMSASSILEAFCASDDESTTQILDRLDTAPPVLFSQPQHYITHRRARYRYAEKDRIPLWLVRPVRGQLSETGKYSLDVSPQRKGSAMLLPTRRHQFQAFALIVIISVCSDRRNVLHQRIYR
jgi:hypothetical protein